ncbi:MAG: hypothetical protein ACM3X9_06140 [Bacillota bacterium]
MGWQRLSPGVKRGGDPVDTWIISIINAYTMTHKRVYQEAVDQEKA